MSVSRHPRQIPFEHAGESVVTGLRVIATLLTERAEREECVVMCTGMCACEHAWG